MSVIGSAARHLEVQRRLEELHHRLSTLLAGFPGGALLSRETPGLPRLSLVVCGVPGSGKSDLVAALLGLASGGELGSGGRKVVIHRHVDAVPGLQLGMGRVERFHEIDILRDLDIIDTPGVEASGFDDIEAIVRGADALLAVFPVEDVWHAGTWSFLSGLNRDLVGRTALVVRHGAMSAMVDVRTAAAHAVETGMRKTGVGLPVFAWGGGEWDEGVGEWFRAVLSARPARERAWRRLRDSAHELIRTAWERACERERDVAGRLHRLAGIEVLAREGGEEWVRARCADPSAEEVLTREFNGVRSLLREKTGVLVSVWRLFAGDRLVQELGAAITCAFERGVRAVLESDREEAAAWGAAYWDLVADGIRQETGEGQRPGFPGVPASLAGVDDFVPAAAPCIHSELVRLRDFIGSRDRARERSLSLPVGAGLLCTSAAAVCGIFERGEWALPGLQAAAVLFLVAPLVAWYGRWRILRRFDREISVSVRDLAGALAGVRRDAVRGAAASCARAVASCGKPLRQAMEEVAEVTALRAEIAGILAVSSEGDP